MLSSGDALIGIDEWSHLFCVLATDEDAGMAALVGFTAHRPQNWRHRTCAVVHPGEHEWIRANCCPYFHGASLAHLDDLVLQFANGCHLRPKPLHPALLARIQQAAISSPLTPFEVKAVLRP